MIRLLKLQKAVFAMILGIVALIIAQVMISNKSVGAKYVLGLAGFFMMVGAFLFLYPILFAKKNPDNGEEVHLRPIAKQEKDVEEI